MACSTGTKPLVLDGHTADWVLVAARTQEGLGTFLRRAPVGRARARPRRHPQASPASSSTTRRPSRSGPTGDHTAVWRRVVDDGAVALCAETLGVDASRRFDLAVEYAKDRVQFDRPIATFQAIKHKVVDMLQRSSCPGSACTTRRGRPHVDDPVRAEAAAMAKASWPRRPTTSCGETIQIHGGVGFTWDCDAHSTTAGPSRTTCCSATRAWHAQGRRPLPRHRLTTAVSGTWSPHMR